MLNGFKCDRERFGYTNDQNLFDKYRSNTVLIVEKNWQKNPCNHT